MSTLLNEIKTTFRNEKRDWKKRRAFFKASEADITAVLDEIDLSTASSGRMDCDADDINFYVTGAAPALKEIYRTFRKLGYDPSKRPGVKPESTFTCYFTQTDKPTFYLSFSSTVCKRVKVGTKTVEQDIYEVVCE
jgi:hypothetical protein